jgi:hypothetical protein
LHRGHQAARIDAKGCFAFASGSLIRHDGILGLEGERLGLNQQVIDLESSDILRVHTAVETPDHSGFLEGRSVGGDPEGFGGPIDLCDLKMLRVDGPLGFENAFACQLNARIDTCEELASPLPLGEFTDQFELQTRRCRSPEVRVGGSERDRFEDLDEERFVGRSHRGLSAIDLQD